MNQAETETRIHSDASPDQLNDVLGEAETYDQLAAILAARRQSLGLSQMDLGYIAGLQDGYIAKLEIGHKGDDAPRVRKRAGRTAGPMSLYVWLKALGVKLVVVKDDDTLPPQIKERSG